jgi:hypothetical protein
MVLVTVSTCTPGPHREMLIPVSTSTISMLSISLITTERKIWFLLNSIQYYRCAEAVALPDVYRKARMLGTSGVSNTCKENSDGYVRPPILHENFFFFFFDSIYVRLGVHVPT